MIISVVLAIVDNLTGAFNASLGVGLLGGLYGLGTLIPSIAVTVRRLHDTARSGWWILIGLVPIVGGLILLVFTVLDGTPGENNYGPDSKTAAA